MSSAADLDLFRDDEEPDVSTIPEILTAASLSAPQIFTAEIIPDSSTGSPSPDTPVSDRRGYIGGSDAAVICGLSPWKTPYELWREKVGEVEPDDLSENERVYFGTILEEIVAHEYERRSGNRVRRVNRLITHPEYPWMCAHIDRMVLNSDRILECKTADGANAADWGEEGTAEIPVHYIPQVQHYLAVTGRAACDVAVLIGGNKFRMYTVQRDDEFIGAMIDLEREFWQCVETRTPPEPSTRSDAVLRWKTPVAELVTGSPVERDLVRLWSEKSEQKKALEAEIEEIELSLMRAMENIGDTLIFGTEVLATWKTERKPYLDQKRLKEEMPEVHAKYYLADHTTRVFRVKKPKK
jgi:putative phage-type endonuclease